ncbi:hypothetical protein CBM2587_B10072 [Cupriavidus taiwanensis]|uniref:Uncharacterized protein n=1 Tax=Cupriavidus taiwanensis TaxID=164546 RepID=A0A975X483_9BURK|nr:hypothetical protein CBM2587_B10072 [Cupriavidus taiwanensis]
MPRNTRWRAAAWAWAKPALRARGPSTWPERVPCWPLQQRQQGLAPGHPVGLEADAALQQRITQLLRAVHVRRREIAPLDGQVGLEAGAVQRDQPPHLVAQAERADHRIGAQLDQDFLALVQARARRQHPARQFVAARGQHPVNLLAVAAIRPGLAFRRLAFIGGNPAAVRHAAQFAIDLLVRGMPEITDGAVEAPRQVVAGRGLFDQGDQQGVLGRHASGLGAGYRNGFGKHRVPAGAPVTALSKAGAMVAQCRPGAAMHGKAPGYDVDRYIRRFCQLRNFSPDRIKKC